MVGINRYVDLKDLLGFDLIRIAQISIFLFVRF